MKIAERIIAPTIEAILAWIRSKFGRQSVAPQALTTPAATPQQVAPQPAPSSEPQPAPTLAPVEAPPAQTLPRQAAKRRRKTQVQPNAQTLGALLDSLDDSFDSMAIPAMRESWLPKKDIQALYRMGIYVKDDWAIAMQDRPVTTLSRSALPSIASAHFISGKHDTSEALHPRFVFAIRSPSLPAGVQQIPGVAYRFGMCFHGNNELKEDGPRNSLFWMYAWVVVGPDGTVFVPNEMRGVTSEINLKTRCKTYDGGVGKGPRSVLVHNRQSCAPSMFKLEQEELKKGRSQTEYEQFLKSVFAQLLEWWASRDQRWSVGVRKDGHRVTFSIDPKHTSAFFANREKQVTVNGTTKRIIHFVEEHTRSNGAVVKAHVRGLSEFDWRGYRCVVTAPRLRGSVVTNAPIEPVEVERDTIDTPELLTTSQFAARLADHEDRLGLPV